MITSMKELKLKLIELAEKNEIVFICPHIGPDCDAIASAIGIDSICKKIGVKSYIIVDDLKSKIESCVKTIINETPDNICIINKSNAMDILKHNEVLLITTDVNKTELIPFSKLDEFSDILIIDHHQIGPTTIKTPNIYIDTNISSASEIVFNLMNMFNIKFNELQADGLNISNYLLSGINLDTAKYSKNMGPNTMKVVAKLMEKGASMNYVNDLFLNTFDDDMRMYNLVSNTMWINYTIGIALDEENSNKIYLKEDLARAADFLIKYKGVNLAFALGYIEENLAYISGRRDEKSENINIGEIMASFGGGGNNQSGAAVVATDDIKTLKKTLSDRITPGYYLK